MIVIIHPQPLQGTLCCASGLVLAVLWRLSCRSAKGISKRPCKIAPACSSEAIDATWVRSFSQEAILGWETGDLAWLEFFCCMVSRVVFSPKFQHLESLYINCINCINLTSSRYFTIPASLSPFSSAIHWRTYMSSVPPNVSTPISVLVPCFVFFSKIIQAPEIEGVGLYLWKKTHPFFSGGKTGPRKNIILIGPVPSWGSLFPLIIAAVSCSPQSSWIFNMSISPNDDWQFLIKPSWKKQHPKQFFKGVPHEWLRSSINQCVYIYILYDCICIIVCMVLYCAQKSLGGKKHNCLSTFLWVKLFHLL